MRNNLSISRTKAHLLRSSLCFSLLVRGHDLSLVLPPFPPPRWTSPTAGAIPLFQRGVCDYPVYHTPIAIAITPLLEGNRLPPLRRRGIGVFSPSFVKRGMFPLPYGGEGQGEGELWGRPFFKGGILFSSPLW